MKVRMFAVLEKEMENTKNGRIKKEDISKENLNSLNAISMSSLHSV